VDYLILVPKSFDTSEEAVCDRILKRTIAWLKQTI